MWVLRVGWEARPGIYQEALDRGEEPRLAQRRKVTGEETETVTTTTTTTKTRTRRRVTGRRRPRPPGPSWPGRPGGAARPASDPVLHRWLH